MPFKTHMTDMRPRRDKYKKEILLPSGGFARREAFPGGMITVYPWDTDVDAWLREQNRTLPLAEQGLVLYRAIEKLANLNGCPLGSFAIGDVFSVLLHARSILTDSQIEYAAECPFCGYNEIDKIHINEMRIINQKDQTYEGTDKIVLPDAQDELVLRPLLIDDEIAIVSRTPENRGTITDELARLIAPIVSINGGQPDNRDELFRWFSAISPKDAKFIEQMEDQMTPHLDMKLPHRCDRCSKEFEHELVLSKEFFRSGRFTKS